MNEEKRKAILYADAPPTKEQEARFCSFLEERCGEEVELIFEHSADYPGGFRLSVGDTVYDWSADARLRQLARALSAPGKDVVSLLKEFSPEIIAEEVGSVISVGDGIARVSGLPGALYGEILLFSEGVRGMVLDLSEDSVGCVLFGEVSADTPVYRTGKMAGIPVGDALLGRVVNALGAPIDQKGAIRTEDYRPIEHESPGIPDRKPVRKPLETGILAIDAMFPIGRGQRELIIGDRQTGKTAIALDTILNQKDKGVICIYVAIGQKTGSVVRFCEALKKHGASDYTVVISAGAGEPAPMQYLAPYAGCAVGEYFMEQGRDVLIVYDDLSKHAVAYRSISLLLGRAPGREAYPGDVFYLHSRLLERSACLSDALGGGSMTALPIVETQAGDVSAYIPTNIISITDGQIFLESDLFYRGQRPAVNVGLSVSRVGGDAQTKLMKKSAGSLRLELSQYREMEVFTRFSGDLDEATKTTLRHGEALMRMLKQPQYRPLSYADEVFLLCAASSGYADDVTDFPALLEELKTELPELYEAVLSDSAPADLNERIGEATKRCMLQR